MYVKVKRLIYSRTVVRSFFILFIFQLQKIVIIYLSAPYQLLISYLSETTLILKMKTLQTFSKESSQQEKQYPGFAEEIVRTWFDFELVSKQALCEALDSNKTITKTVHDHWGFHIQK